MKSMLIFALMITSVSSFAGTQSLCPGLPPSPAGEEYQDRQAAKYVSNGLAIAYGRTAIDAVRELEDGLEASKDSELIIGYNTGVKKPLTLSSITVIENSDDFGCKTYYATVSVSANK